MPSSWSARMTRTAISPRFATRTRLNGIQGAPCERLELEEHLAELDRLRVVDVDLSHDRLEVGLHLVHQLHGLEDAERLPRTDDVALLDERRRSRLGSPVERPDHRRLDTDDAVRRLRDRRRPRLGQRERRAGDGRRRQRVRRRADGDAHAVLFDRELADARFLHDADDLADALGTLLVDAVELVVVAARTVADVAEQAVRVLAEEPEKK